MIPSKYCPVFFLVFLISLSHCSKNSISPEQATLDEMQKKVEDISDEVAKLRGMNFVRPIRVGVISRDEFASSMSQSISSSISSIEEAALSKEYAQMGFLAESDTPLNTIIADFYTSFPAAFYSIGTDSLTIITQAEDYSEFTLNRIIAHELTHALQDQRLNMMPTIFPEYSSYSSDASNAQRSLLEGDALLMEAAYVYTHLYSSMSFDPFDSSFVVVDDLKKDMLNESYSAGSPVFLDIQSSVPYFFGAAYVAEAYHTRGGWDAVNNLYSISSVPRSTAEINRMAPSPITYFDFHAIQGLLVSQPGAIEFADDDNAGFALLLGLFYGDLDTARVRRSLDWLGDRYTYVKRAGGEYGTLVWAMAFANEDAARYLFGKLADKIGSRRLAGNRAAADSTVDTSGRAAVYSFTSASATTKLKRIDDQVWWLENADTLTQTIMDMLQAQMSAPSLAKAAKSNSFPASLSAETKRLVIEGIMRHVFARKSG